MSRKPFDRLAADAIAAEKAGMSYGKWKTLHPHTPDPAPEKTVPVHIKGQAVTKKCLSCGSEFVVPAHNAGRKYCGDTCRDREAKRRYRATHPLQVRKCLFCGKEIDAKGGKQFCDARCKMSAYRLRKFGGNGETA